MDTNQPKKRAASKSGDRQSKNENGKSRKRSEGKQSKSKSRQAPDLPDGDDAQQKERSGKRKAPKNDTEAKGERRHRGKSKQNQSTAESGFKSKLAGSEAAAPKKSAADPSLRKLDLDAGSDGASGRTGSPANNGGVNGGVSLLSKSKKTSKEASLPADEQQFNSRHQARYNSKYP